MTTMLQTQPRPADKVRGYAPEITGCFPGMGELSSIFPAPDEDRQIPTAPVVPKKKKIPISAFSFFNCSNDTDVEPETPSLLDWRSDPSISLSDWSIVVNTPGSKGENSKTYHVHRNMMLSSQLFQQIFREEAAGGQSEIEVPEEAATKFPDFLDYMYLLKRDINRGNAVPLYYLSRLVGVNRLRWESKRFWSNDLSLETVAGYYEGAIIFQEEILMGTLLQACLKDQVLRGFDTESKIITIPCPRLWVFLAKSIQREQSEHLSKIIAAFCILHKEHLDAEVFNDLTQPLPVVEVSAAVTLLKLESELVKPPLMTNLQRASIRAFSESWEKLDVASAEFNQMMASQTPQFLSRVYAKTVLKAQVSAKSVAKPNSHTLVPTKSDLRESFSLVDQEQPEKVDERAASLDPIITPHPVKEVSATAVDQGADDLNEGARSVDSPLTVDEAVKDKITKDAPQAGERVSLVGIQVEVDKTDQTKTPATSSPSSITEPVKATAEI